MGTQLRDLRAMVARECDDWVQTFSAENSADESVWIDPIALYENDHHFRGSDLWITNDTTTVANQGVTVRVYDSSMASTSLTLAPNYLAAAPVTGDEGWLFNIGGQGNRVLTYDATINDCIRGLGEAGYPVYTEEIVPVWDQAITWWAIPALFTHVASAQYLDAYSNWNDVPTHAIAVDVMAKTFAIDPTIAGYAHGYTLRLLGKKKPDALVNDTDETDVDPEWLQMEASARLLLNKRDQLKVNKGGANRNLAAALIGKAGTFNLIEGMIRVR